MSAGNILYPNVTSLPSTGVGASERAQKKDDRSKAEFDQVFDRAISGSSSPAAGSAGLTTGSDPLGELRSPLKFSAHATQRMNERKIAIDQPTMAKVNDAVDKAAAKGVEDTLVLTGNAALIVNVPNRTVITAMDRGSLTGNVFTNIDGAVIV